MSHPHRRPAPSVPRAGRLDAKLERLRRIPLLVCDEVGYIPFAPEATALSFAMVSSRYEHSRPGRRPGNAVIHAALRRTWTVRA
jgi:hypothetical protein